MKLGFLILLFLFRIACYGQTDDDITNIVLKYPRSFSNPVELALKLNEDFHDDKNKAKAIYCWMAHNIGYDIKLAYGKKRRKKSFRYRRYKQLTRKRDRLNNKIIRRTLKSSNATCDGYSRLFKKLCDLTGVQCSIISGYARTDKKEIGHFPYVGRHAWNMVYFDNDWHLVDTTWGAGSVDRSRKIFYPRYTEACFDIPAEKFYLNHFAFKKSQSLSKITKKEFIQLPLCHLGYYKWDGIKICEPKAGVIDHVKENVIKLKIETGYKSVDFGFAIDGINVSKNVQVIRDGNFLDVELSTICKKGYLTVYYKDSAIMTYKIMNTGERN